jgi:hypothetical protein
MSTGEQEQLSQLSSRQHLIHILGPEIRKTDRKQPCTDLLENKENNYSRTGTAVTAQQQAAYHTYIGTRDKEERQKQPRTDLPVQ